jgi:hypothetical protein
VPEETAILARALLATPGRRLALLPAGEATIETVGVVEVSSGGQTERVTQHAISGLGLEPSRIWLDERRELFASGDEWGAIVRKGWEGALPTSSPRRRGRVRRTPRCWRAAC